MKLIKRIAIGLLFALAPTIAMAAGEGRVPINSWGHFAELATAIGLAYANLENFRYRDKVRKHILGMLKDTGFKNNFVSFYRQNPTAIEASFLINMGRLSKEDNICADFDPAQADANRDWYEALGEVAIFRKIYSNNLDKIIAVVLAVLAGLILWFGALDEAFYSQAVASDVLRNSFLAGCALGMPLAFGFGVVSYFFSRATGGSKLIAWLFSILGALSFILASTNAVPGAAVLAAHAQNLDRILNDIIGVFLFIASAVPIALVLLGDGLRSRMAKKATNCGERIKKAKRELVDKAHVSSPVDGN